MLADYAVRVEHSRGRRHPEPRILTATTFNATAIASSMRALFAEAKTQVFTRRYSDHFRNRLTHTIEVAQISRTVAAHSA